MLTLVMKRQLTNQQIKDIEDCFIYFKRDEVSFDDGIKFHVTKNIQEIPVDNSESVKVTYVNIAEFYNGINIGNYVYDHAYYSNILIPLIKNSFNMSDPEHSCGCGHDH